MRLLGLITAATMTAFTPRGVRRKPVSSPAGSALIVPGDYLHPDGQKVDLAFVTVRQYLVMDIDQPAPPTALAVASLTRRALAWFIDYLVVMVPGATLVGLALMSLVHGLPAYLGAVGGQVGWAHLLKLFTQHGSELARLGTAATHEWIPYVIPVLGALALVPVLQFGYHAISLAWRGRTFGKFVTDTRVGVTSVGASRVSGRRALRRALATTVLETGLVGTAFIVVTIGQFRIGMLIWAVAIAAFWLNAFTALGRRHRTIVDRISGTTVVRTALHAKVADTTTEIAGAATRKTAEIAAAATHKTAEIATAATYKTAEVAVAATYKTAEIAVTATHKTADLAIAAKDRTTAGAVKAAQVSADAASVVGELTLSGMRAIADTKVIKQVVASDAAAQARQLGEAGMVQARNLGEQATGKIKRLGGRFTDGLRQRQSNRLQAVQLSEADTQQPPREAEAAMREIAGEADAERLPHGVADLQAPQAEPLWADEGGVGGEPGEALGEPWAPDGPGMGAR